MSGYTCKTCGTEVELGRLLGGQGCPNCGGTDVNSPPVDPEGPVCDFCSGTPVQWSYPARDFRGPADMAAIDIKTGRVTSVSSFGSSGWWAACTPCHRLIRAGKREHLAKRSAKASNRRNERAGLPTMPLSKAIPLVRKFHDNFWANREGDPVHGEPPTEEGKYGQRT